MQTTHQQSSGIEFVQKPGGQIEWSVRHEARARIARFHEFQIEASMRQEASAGLFAACLVAFDGLSPAHLGRLNDASTFLYRIGNANVMEWKASDPARIERRRISTLTARSWFGSVNERATKETLFGSSKDLRGQLSLLLRALPAYAKVDRPLVQLVSDQICWLHEFLPAMLFAHVAEVSPFCAIPRSAWVRMERQRPIREFSDAEVHDIGAAGTLVEATLEAEGEAFSAGLIRMAEDCFKKSHPSAIDGHTKRLWAQELEELASRVRRAHPSVGIVIGWGAHLAEAGTVDSSNPAADTVKRYALRVMHPLASALHALPANLDQWTPERMHRVYLSLMEATTPSSRSETSAALSSFHAYLQEWFDVAPLEAGVGKWAPSAPSISANIVWEHEIHQCIEFSRLCEDKRLGNIAECCFWIAKECPVRIQDLLRLRLHHVRFGSIGGQAIVEIDVVRNASHGRLKTTDSQRRLVIREPKAIRCIRDWCEQRRGEAAPEGAVLFGDPNDDRKVYRRAALHGYLNALVKQVSGDSSIRFHHLRHSRISQSVETIIRSSNLADVNQMEILAAEAGHSSPRTTLSTYTHLYSESLRQWLDLALIESLKVSGAQGQALLGIKANTLIQTARRRRVSLAHHVWTTLESKGKDFGIERVDAGFSCSEVVIPTVSKGTVFRVTPVTVADAMLRLARGDARSSAEPLVGLSGEAFCKWEASVIDWLARHARALFPRKHLKAKLTGIGPLLHALDLDVDRLFSDRMKSLREFVTGDPPSDLLKNAVISWESCGRGSFISLEDGTQPRGLFRLLKAAGIEAAAVRLVFQTSEAPTVKMAPGISSQSNQPCADEFSDRRLPSNAERIFEQEFGQSPMIETRSPRVDRPKAYLVLSSTPRASITRSAATTNGVFKAWMVMNKAYLLLSNKSED